MSLNAAQAIRHQDRQTPLTPPKIEVLDLFNLGVHSMTGEPAQAGVLVVDMLNDFAHEGGSLFVQDSLQTIEPIGNLIKRASAFGVPSFFTNDKHNLKDQEFQIWPEHAVKNTWGAKIIEPLTEVEIVGDNFEIIDKLRYDPFYETSLDHLLRIRGINTLILTGTVANICVLAAAHSAALRWYDLIVPLDCWSALEDFGYWAAAYQMDRLYRAKLISTAAGINFTRKQK